MATTDLAADRARRGWTLAQMADYLGVPLGTYLNWERGRRKPPPMVTRLLQVLNIIEMLAPEIHAALTSTCPAPVDKA